MELVVSPICPLENVIERQGKLFVLRHSSQEVVYECFADEAWPFTQVRIVPILVVGAFRPLAEHATIMISAQHRVTAGQRINLVEDKGVAVDHGVISAIGVNEFHGILASSTVAHLTDHCEAGQSSCLYCTQRA